MRCSRRHADHRLAADSAETDAGDTSLRGRTLDHPRSRRRAMHGRTKPSSNPTNGRFAPALAAEVAVEALRVLRPVRQFVGESGVIALGITEGFEGRHLHVVQSLRIVSAISAVFDRSGHAGKELLRVANASHGIKSR